MRFRGCKIPDGVSERKLGLPCGEQLLVSCLEVLVCSCEK